MSLLDDVSIVVTPNAYKAYKLYSVLPTSAEGSELVTNGDFSGGTTGWSSPDYNSTLSIDSGQMKIVSTLTLGRVVQGITTVIGKKYLVSGTITNIDSSTGIQLKLSNGANLDGAFFDSAYNTTTNPVTITHSFTATATTTYIGSSQGSSVGQSALLDNVSVKEDTTDMFVTRATAATRVDENGLVNYAEVLGSEQVINGDFDTDSNWSKGANTTISGGKLNSNSAGVYVIAYQSGILTQNQVCKYSVTYTITSGSVRLGDSVSVWSGSLQSTSGTYTGYITVASSSDSNLYITSPSSDFVGSIDNISVKEVTRNNVPRIDYTGGGCPHILAEPQRTNLETKSNGFSTWSANTNVTRTADYITSPDGTQNATRLQFTANGSCSNITQSLGSYTISCYAKRNDSGTQDVGFFTNGSGVVNSAWSLTSDWKRFTYTFPALNAGAMGIAGNSGADVSVFGCQLEGLASYATSYIPTSGSSVTRNQDLFTRNGIASLINSTEGVLFAEIAALFEDGNNRYVALSDGSLSNRVVVRYIGGNVINALCVVGGASQASLSHAVSNITNYSKVAFKYKANDFALWIDGVEVATDTSGTLPSSDTLNSLNLSGSTGLSSFFFGKVRQLQVYKTALTDAQLTSLTS